MLICCVVFFCAVLAQAQESISARATPLVSTVNLGDVSPGGPTVGQSPQGNLVVRVASDAFWQLAVAPDVAALSRGEGDVAISTDGVAWRSADSSPVVTLATGPATGSEGALVSLSLRVRPDFGTRTGQHELPLVLVMNGRRLQAPVRVVYNVLPTVSLDQDGDRFTIAADKPSERREYDSNTRTYVVRSNAPWNLEVCQNSSEERPFSVEVMDLAGRYRAVNRPVVIAASGPTGDSGTVVPLRLRLKLQDATVGGVYATDLNVKARVVEEPGTNGSVPSPTMVR